VNCSTSPRATSTSGRSPPYNDEEDGEQYGSHSAEVVPGAGTLRLPVGDVWSRVLLAPGTRSDLGGPDV
jgi:hypothetical protein